MGEVLCRGFILSDTCLRLVDSGMGRASVCEVFFTLVSCRRSNVTPQERCDERMRSTRDAASCQPVRSRQIT